MRNLTLIITVVYRLMCTLLKIKLYIYGDLLASACCQAVAVNLLSVEYNMVFDCRLTGSDTVTNATLHCKLTFSSTIRWYWKHINGRN